MVVELLRSLIGGMETPVMKRKSHTRTNRTTTTKSVLRLPDLEHAKAVVLNSLNSADAKRGCRHAIEEFVDWCCSEPRLAFNRIVVLRYRSHLESRSGLPCKPPAQVTLKEDAKPRAVITMNSNQPRHTLAV